MWPLRLESTGGREKLVAVYVGVWVEKGVRYVLPGRNSRIRAKWAMRFIWKIFSVASLVVCVIFRFFDLQGDGTGWGCGRTWRMGLPFAMPALLMRTVGSPWTVLTSAQTFWRSELLEMSRW